MIVTDFLQIKSSLEPSSHSFSVDFLNSKTQVRGSNGSAAILAAKRSAGVAPEVNLRIPMQASEGIHPGFENQRRHL